MNIGEYILTTLLKESLRKFWMKKLCRDEEEEASSTEGPQPCFSESYSSGSNNDSDISGDEGSSSEGLELDICHLQSTEW